MSLNLKSSTHISTPKCSPNKKFLCPYCNIIEAYLGSWYQVSLELSHRKSALSLDGSGISSKSSATPSFSETSSSLKKNMCFSKNFFRVMFAGRGGIGRDALKKTRTQNKKNAGFYNKLISGLCLEAYI